MDYVKPFLIGGSVIAGSKYVSTYFSPALAPLIGGMPTGIIASMFLASEAEKRKYFDGYIYSSFTLFLTILFVHQMVSRTKLQIDLISIVALILWGVISYIIVNKFVKK